MKNIDLLPLDDEVKKRLKTFARMYKQNTHIETEIISFDANRLIVRAEQKDTVNSKLLTKKELTERIKDMFAGEIPEEWKITVSAVDYDRKDIDSVSPLRVKKR